MDGQPREIAVVAGQDDLLDGRGRARHLLDGGLPAQAREHFRQQFVGGRAEGGREARAAARQVAAQGDGVGAGLLEQHGFRIAFQEAGDLGQVDRPGMALELVRVERGGKAAQVEALEVRAGRGRPLRRRTEIGMGIHCCLQRVMVAITANLMHPRIELKQQ